MGSSASFRDPAGRLVREHGQLIRIVSPEYADEYRSIFAAPWMHQLIDDGDVIQTVVVEDAGADDLHGGESELRLLHDEVGFPSYPSEWPLEMLIAAGDLTLRLSESVLSHGFGLKDATPYNVLFRGPRPVLVDVLSFERRSRNSVIWEPYAQFVRTFLIPILLMGHQSDLWRGAFLLRRDGIEPEEAYQTLSVGQRWGRQFAGSVTIPALLTRMTASERVGRSPHTVSDPERAEFILQTRFRSLRRKLSAARRRRRRSAWSNYCATCTYSDAAFVQKSHFVQQVLEADAPTRVLDVGCNTGHFSMLAAARGVEVVAVDTDPTVVGQLWERARAEDANVLPLVVDLARPTPAIGWRNGEAKSFCDRASQYFECVFMLAVVHHLLVTDQIPLSEIIALAADMTTKSLVIEYVPPQDPQFTRIARGRDALYRWLDEDAFLSALRERFDLVAQMKVEGGGRVLYHARRRHGS